MRVSDDDGEVRSYDTIFVCELGTMDCELHLSHNQISAGLGRQ